MPDTNDIQARLDEIRARCEKQLPARDLPVNPTVVQLLGDIPWLLEQVESMMQTHDNMLSLYDTATTCLRAENERLRDGLTYNREALEEFRSSDGLPWDVWEPVDEWEKSLEVE